MDPVSLVGLAGSIVGITDVITRSLKGLLDIQTAYKTANLRITLIIGHLTTVNAALNEIKTWILGSDAHKQLCSDIQRAVDCCEVIVVALDKRIQAVRDLSIKSKINFACEEKNIKTFLDHLGNQVYALNLLLTAANWHALLADHETRRAFRQIEDDSSSYARARTSAPPSVLSSTSTGLDADFEFDFQIINSDVYRRALRSALKLSLKNDQAQRSTDKATDPGPSSVGMDSRLEVIAPNTNSGKPAAAVEMKATAIASRPPRKVTTVSDTSVQNKYRNVFDRWLKKIETDNQRLARMRDLESTEKLKREREISARTRNILLLGISESGKSTALQQLRRFYGDWFDDESRMEFREVVLGNLILGMRCVVEAMKVLEIPLEHGENKEHVLEVCSVHFPLEGNVLPSALCEAVKVLWADGGVRECVARGREYHLTDGVEHSPDWIPSDLDILWAFVKTTGVYGVTLECDGKYNRFYHVGGVRSERKKWIHVFENVFTIIFTVDIACYDQLLFEDDTVNRMQESLTVFDSIVNSRWFLKTQFILLLLKTDKLKKKLPCSAIDQYFTEMRAGATLKQAKAYIAYAFRALSQNHGMTIMFSSSFEGQDLGYLLNGALRAVPVDGGDAINLDPNSIIVVDDSAPPDDPSHLGTWDDIMDAYNTSKKEE